MGDVIEVLTTATNTVEVEAAGPQGAPGVGVPTGGSAGQVLRKASGTDYDTQWSSSGGGSVDLSSPDPIGDVTPNTGAFTTLSATGTATLPHIHGSLAGNLYIHVKNTSGGELTRGTPVYIVGNVGATDRVEVAAADFDDATKMPAVGLLEQTLANNGSGDAIILGELDEANTNAYTINQELFVGNNGTLTATRPTTGQVQSAGVVARVNSNTGVIVVNMQGQRSPNEAFAATAHASTHHTGGTDALSAHQINGQTIFSTASVTYSSDQTLPANRARQFAVSNTNASGITLTMPTQAEGTLLGDTYVIVGGNTISGPITVRGVANLSPLVYNTLVTITATGQQYRLRSSGGSGGGWALIPVDTHTHTGSEVNVGTTANLPLRTGTNGVIEAGSFGTAAGSFCEGNDARLSDARTPSSTLAHAASHLAGTPAVAASYTGIGDNETFSEEVTIIANTAGTAGNSITLTFDGVDDVDTVLAAWNAANPSNQATLDSGDGGQVPDDGDSLQLSGGIASTAGSDPIYDQDLSTTDAVEFAQVDIYRTETTVQDSALKALSTQPSTFAEGGIWRGRIMAGAENKTFLMGAAYGEAGLGAHSWSSAAAEDGAAWADFLLNPDGGASVFIGCQTWDKDTAIVKISNATGTVEIAASDDQTKRVSIDVTGVTEETTRTLEIPDASGKIALQGAITTSGLTQATARILGRTTASTGAVEEITVGSGLSLSAGELSATGSGVTAVGASTADVLSVSGSDLVADDPNADRIVFWDDSESKLRYLEAGSGLSISGTTMTASGGASIMQAIAVGFVLN